MNTRSVLSPVVAVMFVATVATGLLLLVHVRSGGVHLLHETAGIVFASAGFIHLVVNWKPFVALFRRRRAVIGCALAAGFIIAMFFAGMQHERDDPQFARHSSGLRMR